MGSPYKKSHDAALNQLKDVLAGIRSDRTPIYMNGKMSKLAVIIKQYKVKHGMSTERFASHAGVGASTVDGFSRRNGMRAAQFIKVSKALGKEPVAFFQALERSADGKGVPEGFQDREAHTTRQYVVIENFQPGFDLVATEFQLVPATQRDQ